MPKIVTTDQMRAIEQAADAQGHSYARMMERAGAAVAACAQERLAGIDAPRVVVLVGSGNNGGDGLVAARLLREWVPDSQIGAYLLAERDPAADPVFAGAQGAGVEMVHVTARKRAALDRLKESVRSAHLVIDALFGTRLRLPIAGDAAAMLRTVHEGLALRGAEHSPQPFITPADPAMLLDEEPVILAVDCPSGLHCDTGECDPLTLRAHDTVTFAAAKPGLFVFPGAETVGRLHIGDIGLPSPLPALDEVRFTLVDAAETGARLPHRPRSSHKGTHGKALIVGGSLNLIGAPVLAGSGAYRVGAGLVTIAAPEVIVPVLAGMLPEATWLLLPHEMGVVMEDAVRVLRAEVAGYTALLIGPGLGADECAARFLRDLLCPAEDRRGERALGFALPGTDSAPAGAGDCTLPALVLDADALNLLARMDDWPRLVPPNSILTPHPAEFGRLARRSTAEVQADRLALAQAKAAEWGCIVVLKGAFTIVAAPDGRAALLPFATSALAKAGTGDVLAGVIVGLLAQGLDPYDAALAGGWLHGMAGVRAAQALETEASVTARDVIEMLAEAYTLAETAQKSHT